MKKENKIELNPIMDENEKEQFINEHIELISSRMREKFYTWPLETKFDYIQKRIEWEKSVKEAKENAKLCNQVKKLMMKKKATVNEVQEVIDICHTFIDELKKDEIEKIDKEIERLIALKKEIE